MSNVHIFWDNSNIHIVGRNHVMQHFEPDENPKLFRSYFKNLFKLAHRNRPIGSAYVVGSIPPPNSNLWKHIRALGVTLELLERTASNKEAGVDQTLQVWMYREAHKNRGKDDTFIVLSGDGAGKKLGKGFLNDLEFIREMGYNVEVISWERGTNQMLKQFAKDNGLFIPLEDYYYNVTFIKGKRSAIEDIDFNKLSN